MARILLGVTGGISAYKSVELARLAIKAGHSVRVVQTAASERFVGAATFEVRAVRLPAGMYWLLSQSNRAQRPSRSMSALIDSAFSAT